MNKGGSEDLELEKYFDALRREAPVPPKKLVGAILRDSRAHAPERKYEESNSSAKKQGFWTFLFSALGGPVPAAALAATVLLGVGLGYGTIDYFAEFAVSETEYENSGNEIFAALDDLLAEI